MPLHPESMAAHAGTADRESTRDVTPAIHLSTTFERAEDGSYPGGFVYSRSGNPTRDLFERTLAELEGGAACAAFSSGMAAVSAVFQSLRPGDHVIIPDDVYHGTRHLAHTLFEPWGLEFTAADLSDPAAFDRALRPNTRLVWLETPSNPLVRITDIRATALLARARSITTVVDSTWTTPLVQRPLDLGADLVMHSVTKYLAGHSDVLGGAVVASDPEHPLFQRIRAVQTGAGAVMDPFGAWLALRGIRSLGPRIERHMSNALRIAAFLDEHPRVERVHYPGLITDPGHSVATQQMTGFGGMLSFRVRGGRAEALEVAARVRVFRRATSLGGTESLIEHRASVEPPPARSPENLLRVSAGLEHPDDLIADLGQALSAAR